MMSMSRNIPHSRPALGGESGLIVLSVLAGIALFAVLTLAGYAFTARSTSEPEAIALVEYSGIEVLERTDEAVAAIADATQRDSLMRSLVETGALEDSDLFEAASSAVAGSAGGSTTGVVTEGDVPAFTPDPTDDDVAEPHPVPHDVLADDPSVTAFIDWDEIIVADVPTDFRFDLCAGESPLGVPLPGCPSGTGATIVPVSDDPIADAGGPYRADIYLTGTIARECQEDNDVYRVAVLTNRPSEISLSVWNYRTGDGSFHDPPPRRASTMVFRTEADDAARWYEQLDTGTPDFLIHCVEFTDLDYGRVGVYLRGVSQFLFDGGAVDEDDRSSVWLRATSERPPTGVTAFGSETLYVRAFHRSSVDERIFVQARPFGVQGCDNQGDISRIGESFETVQGVLDRTIPIDTLAGGWRWGSQWDLLDVHRLHLREGEAYAVCIFWVEGGGPIFEPDRVTMSEAVVVLPPDVNTMTVSLDSIQFADWLDDDPRVNFVDVEAALDNCINAAIRTNSTEQSLYVLGPRQMCQPSSLQGVIQRGNFVVTVSATDSLGDTYVRSSLVRVHRGDITCGAPCGERRQLVAVPLPHVSPRAITGYADLFGDDTAAIVPADDDVPGSTGPSVGTATLELLFTPNESTGARSWVFGEPVEIEQTSRRLPLRPQIEVRVTSSGGGYYFTGEERTDPVGRVQVEVLADRPVDIVATITGHPGEACLRGVSTPPSLTSTARVARHVFEVDNLCVGTPYDLLVTATDETGTTGELFGVGPADGTTPWTFVTQYIPVAVFAELTFAAPGPVPSDSPTDAWYFSHEQQLYVIPLATGRRDATPSWSVATPGGVERSMTGWSSNDPYDAYSCDRSYDVELSRSLPRSIPGSASLWPVDTNEQGVHIVLNATLGVGQLGDELSTPFGFNSCSRRIRDVISSYTFSEDLSLADLVRGVEFVSDDGLVRLWVSSRPRR